MISANHFSSNQPLEKVLNWMRDLYTHTSFKFSTIPILCCISGTVKFSGK